MHTEIERKFIVTDSTFKQSAVRIMDIRQGYVGTSSNGEARVSIRDENHINGNTLDNRKQNLRLCTNAENLQNRVNIPTNNSSGIIGVHFDRSRNKWKVEIGVNGKNKYIGRYNTLEEATKARRDAELLYYNVNYEINQTKL